MMSFAQEEVSKFFSTLSHPLRREILIYISKNGEQSFTDLMKALNVDTGKMSFHMRRLRLLLEQDLSGKYRLNKLGDKALLLIGEVKDLTFQGELGPKESVFSIASFTDRAIAFFIDFSMAFIVFLLPTIITDVFLARIGEGIRSPNQNR